MAPTTERHALCVLLQALDGQKAEQALAPRADASMGPCHDGAPSVEQALEAHQAQAAANEGLSLITRALRPGAELDALDPSERELVEVIFKLAPARFTALAAEGKCSCLAAKGKRCWSRTWWRVPSRHHVDEAPTRRLHPARAAVCVRSLW